MHLTVRILILILTVTGIRAQTYKFAVLKYSGGGDWYANPTSVPNLVAFCNKNLKMNISPDVETVEAGSPEIFNYPYLHMTGHGTVIFSTQEVQNLRNYLLGGGFLHIDDNYGMDKFIRQEIKKIFPDVELTELPVNHPIYRQKYSFPKGLPKIHEHDNKPAQAFGIQVNGRLVLLYTHETDLGDGWEDAEVHKDSEEKREQALRMGANIVRFVMSGALVL
jgi:hypothetical protein